MASIVVNMKALPSLLRDTDARIREAVFAGSAKGCERARSYIVPRTPMDLGPGREGWKVRQFNPDVHRKRAMVTVAELYNDAPQIFWQENGTRPHAVSRAGVAAIYQWVRRHFRGGKLGSGNASRGRMRRPRQDEDDPVIRAITWAIVAKLKKYGTKPKLFVLNALPEMRRLMATECAKALNAAQAIIERQAAGRGR